MSSKLREVSQLAQSEVYKGRRWFNSPAADLYVWLENEQVVHFEYSYHKPYDEHILVWKSGLGFKHMKVDDGESNPGKNQSPLVESQIQPDYAAIARNFREDGLCIDAGIYRFVIKALYENV